MTTNNAINVSIPYKFSAYRSDVDNGVTGDATNYHVVCDVAICNINNAYSTRTGNFTTPVAGMWLLGGNMNWGDCVVANTQFNVMLQNNALVLYRYVKLASGNTYRSDFASWSTVISLAASEVIAMYTEVDGNATKNVSVSGGSVPYVSWYGIYLGA